MYRSWASRSAASRKDSKRFWLSRVTSRSTARSPAAGASALRDLIGADAVHEPNALAAAIDRLYPEVRTVIEMGREAQKYLLFERDPLSGRLLVEDSNLGNKCASGSGSFLDHMATRLNYPSIVDFARVALETESPASLSGRCAVFTESDITHLYQKGTPRDRIAAGIHQAISRNYRSAIARGKEFRDKIAFIGGVSENPAVVKYLSEELEVGARMFVPEHNRTMGAIGAAIRAANCIDIRQAIAALEAHLRKPLEYPGTDPIRLEKSEIHWKTNKGNLSEQLTVVAQGLPKDIERAALGVDIGSVSTKAALVTEIDGKFVVLAHYYRRTDGDPLSAVRDTLAHVHAQLKANGFNIGKISAATTGSGRYLTGDYIGADLIRNEITAQASGALSYADDVDTILEIGGQDSKYVRLDGDVIIDFEMNKACAAGTGAFLEKQASRLGIPLEDFGDKALSNTRPPDLDWTCTVFSESAMVYYQQNNVPVEDLAAGVCLASVKNYMNKNIGSREIGGKIAFQGAVAFNKGMVAAYETVLGRKIVVPPYPHITGAVGAARLAYLANPEVSTFKGFDAIADAKYEITSFECKSCANHCDVNTFQMDGGPKYFYNDRCEKFSAVHKKRLGENLPDLFAERERIMFDAYTKKAPAGATRVGVPRGLMFDEFFPLYNAFLTELGFEVVPSDRTNKRIIEMGLEVAIGEPCFPFKVAHGHYMDLIEKKVDIIFAPRIISTEQPNPKLAQAQTCPYLQAAPDVISSCVGVTERGIRHIAPTLHFKRGRKHLLKVFTQVARELGKSPKQASAAFEAGMNAMMAMRGRIAERGAEVLRDLPEGQMAFVVIGRPYTLWDSALNMDIGKKIQDLGILAIPQDFLPLPDSDITDVWPLMYSRQIQKKLMAARVIRNDVRLKAVVLTYFACGPDSFGNPFFKDEIGEPCYVMQIDEHTADAGVITRIEAFSDTAGKGALKEYEEIRSTDTPITSMAGRTLWIPYANEAARMLAASHEGLRHRRPRAAPLTRRGPEPGPRRDLRGRLPARADDHRRHALSRQPAGLRSQARGVFPGQLRRPVPVRDVQHAAEAHTRQARAQGRGHRHAGVYERGRRARVYVRPRGLGRDRDPRPAFQNGPARAAVRDQQGRLRSAVRDIPGKDRGHDPRAQGKGRVRQALGHVEHEAPGRVRGAFAPRPGGLRPHPRAQRRQAAGGGGRRVLRQAPRRLQPGHSEEARKRGRRNLARPDDRVLRLCKLHGQDPVQGSHQRRRPDGRRGSRNI